MCLFIMGTMMHVAAVAMTAGVAGLPSGHVDSAMDGGCPDCAMPQDAMMACADVCAGPLTAIPSEAALAGASGRLSPWPSGSALPRGRPGLPEPHPPKSPVTS
jgi:hypothetical protein